MTETIANGMVARSTPPAPPRLALSKREAAQSLGISVDHFQRHVQPHLRAVYSGRRRLYPIRELEQWLEREAVA